MKSLPELNDAQLFAMFNVDCAPTSLLSLNVPLLKVRVRKPKADKRVKHTCDKVREGVTSANPGKGRVADLAAFYALHGEDEISAFED